MVLGDAAPIAREVAHMAQQEQRHLDWFNAALAERGVRPTLLQPFWHVAGYALGAATAALGPEAAMACTAAVETEIDRHYAEQLDELGDSDPELSAAIADFRAEEQEHQAAALASGAEAAPAYPLLAGAIRLGCRAAIALSKRI
jgi:3-demethoxyubiquinol 3-hydroxylase